MLNMKFQNDPSVEKQPLGKKLKVMMKLWISSKPSWTLSINSHYHQN